MVTTASTTGATGRFDRDALVARFAEQADTLPGAALPWLAVRRREAIERFADLGIPTTRHEDWKYTNLKPMTRMSFQPPGREHPSGTVRPLLGPFLSADITRLVFIDGRYAPEHSQISRMPGGAQVTSLRRALENEPELLEPHLSRIATPDGKALTALNTAFLEDGAFILLPEGATKEIPIHLLHITTPHSQPTITHPHNLIVAGPGSRASIVEQAIGSDGATALNNSVTELEVGSGAVIDHYKLQQESAQAFHLSRLRVNQHRDSLVRSHSIALGARLSRYEIDTAFLEQGAECALHGLYLLDGQQHADHFTNVDHAQPHCTSRQLFKGIMNGEARGVFTGRVLVRENAQKTSADQSNKNLLLSDRALAESRPQLEIYADDVRCTHGSAIGHLDEEMIFYLRSRGIAREDAANLLTYAFASEIIDSIRVRLFRTNLQEIFSRWLPAGRM